MLIFDNNQIVINFYNFEIDNLSEFWDTNVLVGV